MWENHKTSIIIGAAITALLLAFWYMQSFAFVFFLSILLTLLLLAPVDKLSLKMPRGLASLLVLGGFLVIFLGLITIVSSNFIPTLSRFTEELPTLATNIQQLNGLTETGLFQKGVDEAWAELTAISTKAIKSSLLIAFSLFNKLIDFVIILFLTFYLLMDGDKIKLYVAHLFPDKDKKRIVNLLDEILLALRTYIRSQLIICFITGFIVYSYFTIMVNTPPFFQIYHNFTISDTLCLSNFIKKPLRDDLSTDNYILHKFISKCNYRCLYVVSAVHSPIDLHKNIHSGVF